MYLFQRNAGGSDSWGQLLKLTADDGAGGVNVAQQAVAFADCAAPRLLSIEVRDITGRLVGILTHSQDFCTPSPAFLSSLEAGPVPMVQNLVTFFTLQRVTPGLKCLFISRIDRNNGEITSDYHKRTIIGLHRMIQ